MRHVLPWLLATVALAAGCTVQPMRVTVTAPIGAEFRILERSAGGEVSPNRPDVETSVPFSAEFEPSDPLGYRVEVVLPADVAERYGVSQETRLAGRMYVYSPTATVAGGVPVAIPLPTQAEEVDRRLRMLVRGELSSIEYFTVDPNAGANRYLVRIVLRRVE